MLEGRLAEARKSAGFSQVQFAVELDCDRTLISHVEANRVSFSAERWIHAARVLRMSTDYLLGLTDDPTPSAELSAKVNDLTDPEALAGPKMPARILEFPASLTPDVLPVPLREEVRAAAGAGAIIDNEAVMGYVPFRRDWLVKHGIHNEKSSVIEVIGDSMEPNLQNRAWTLVDHQRVRRLRNSIFVLGTKDGVIVKRLAKEGGGWQLVSDNRNYKPLPCPQEATVIGQVMWVGRTL